MFAQERECGYCRVRENESVLQGRTVSESHPCLRFGIVSFPERSAFGKGCRSCPGKFPFREDLPEEVCGCTRLSSPAKRILKAGETVYCVRRMRRLVSSGERELYFL